MPITSADDALKILQQPAGDGRIKTPEAAHSQLTINAGKIGSAADALKMLSAQNQMLPQSQSASPTPSGAVDNTGVREMQAKLNQGKADISDQDPLRQSMMETDPSLQPGGPPVVAQPGDAPADQSLGLVSDLALGAGTYAATSKAMKLARLMPSGPLKAAVLTGAVAAPLYAGIKGALEGHSIEEIAKSIPEEELWWAGTPAVLHVAGMPIKKYGPKLLAGVDKLVHEPINKLMKPVEEGVDKVWNTVIESKASPLNMTIPYFKKSAREMLQPAIERIEKLRPPTGRTFRTAEAQKGLTQSLGSWVGEEMEHLTPTERREVTMGLRGADPAEMSGKAKDLLSRFEGKAQSFGLKKRYEAEWRMNLSQLLTKQVEDSENLISGASLGRITDMISNPLGQAPKTREIHQALDELIQNPNARDEIKVFAKDLYNMPSNTTEAVWQASNDASVGYLLSKLKATPGLVSSIEKPGYVMSKYKSMKGLYVPRDVELEFEAMEKVPLMAKGMYQKWFLSPWKTAKVIARPATHMRNMISNAILNDWGGLPVWRVDIYNKALHSLRHDGPEWKEFLNMTGVTSNFTQSELSQLESGMKYGANIFDKAHHVWDKAVGPAGRIYNAEENWFKLAKYIHAREQGMSKVEAATDAVKWTFNYGDITPELAKFSKYAMPFVRWYSKAIPLMAETAVKHPVRFGKWLAFGAGLQNYAMQQNGITDEEWEETNKQLPDYIKNGIYMMMPWRDDKQRLNLMNMTYILPGIGDINELYQRSPIETIAQNPVFTTLATLTSKKKYSGAPLYYDWEKGSVKFAKASAYVWEQLSPSIVPGGTDWNSIWRSISEDESDTASPMQPSPEQATAGLFGFRVTPIDPAAMRARKEAINKIHESEMASMQKQELKKAKTGDEVNAILEKYRLYREDLAN